MWPYATKIRKFPAGGKSMKYAVRNDLPAYTMTTTYHKRKNRKKGDLPRMEIYVDGPFYARKDGTEEERQDDLAKKVYDSMVKYSKKSTYEYFKYIKKKK